MDRLPASSNHEAAGLAKITIVAAKRPGLMISTVAQQPAVVSIAARSECPSQAEGLAMELP
jgi:hypothetical protein